MKKFIQLEDLANNSFVGVQANGRATINLKVNPDTNNMLSVTDRGIMVAPKFENPSYYTFNFTQKISQYNSDASRRRLYVKRDGFGYVHMDFVTTDAIPESQLGTVIGQLPAAAPAAFEHIEIQTSDGGQIWIPRNGRDIRASNLLANKRIIVDLIGFWRL